MSQIGARIAEVRDRIEQACRRSGRSPEEVTLIAVTKMFPEEAVKAAMAAGLRHFGENRVQDLVQKSQAIPGVYRGGDVYWYMIGHLQRNKARDVAAHADYFHALDSIRLASELNSRAEGEGRVLPCLVEVHISQEESKFGVEPESLHDFLDELGQFASLRVRGLMTIASFVDDAEQVRSEFRHMRRLFDSYHVPEGSPVEMKELSMGMSGDFEIAIEEGATHVRVGSAIFGSRG